MPIKQDEPEMEQMLNQMSIPSVEELKHEDILAKHIILRNHKSTISLWWLSVPVYTFAAFLMKSFYYKNTSVISMVRELLDRKSYVGPIVFGILPFLLLIINILSIRQSYYLYGSFKRGAFIQTILSELVFIILSALILLVYGYQIIFN